MHNNDPKNDIEVDPDYIDEDDDHFEPCSNCDGHDACQDFGCAINAGIINEGEHW